MPRAARAAPSGQTAGAGAPAPRVTIAYVRGFFEYVRRRGIAEAPVLEALGIDESAFADPDLRLPLDERLGPALAVAERLSGDPDIGLRAGQALQMNHLGVLGHLLMTCSPEEALDLHVRYQRLVSEVIDARYELLGDQIAFSMDRPAGAPPAPRHVVELFISGWMQFARSMLGETFVRRR